MAAAFVEAVVSGYFAQRQDDIDRDAIEEWETDFYNTFLQPIWF